MRPLPDRSLPRLTMAVCAVLILMMLVGCSTLPPTRPRIDFRDPIPVYAGKTYEDVIRYTLRLQEWGLACVAVHEANRGAEK